MQDARFIYESVDAAKAYLIILVDEVHPEKHLHFMPLRFYLYGIYAAVFLYKVGWSSKRFEYELTLGRRVRSV
jgi:hypothetical protein